MASQVEICRVALSHLADAARVNSIDPPDQTTQAQLCATFYPIARDMCLEAFEWSFATRRHELQESLITEPTDEGEWGFAYLMPSDVIRALRVVPPGTPSDWPSQPYKIYSDITELDTVLFCNVEEAVLHYIFREEETGRYTPTFIYALSLLLGSMLAGPILKGKAGVALKAALLEEFRGTIATAGAHDANASQSSAADKQYKNYVPLTVSDR